MKLRVDLPGRRKLLLSRGGRRSHLLSLEDIPPPIDVGGRDPIAAAEALANRDATIHRPSG
jgi:hypothetical protein